MAMFYSKIVKIRTFEHAQCEKKMSKEAFVIIGKNRGFNLQGSIKLSLE